jgi:hypothetical protein
MPAGFNIDSFIKLVLDRRSVTQGNVVAFLEELVQTTKDLRDVWSRIHLALRAQTRINPSLLSDLSPYGLDIDEPENKDLYQFYDFERERNIRFTASADAFYRSLERTLGGKIPVTELEKVSDCTGAILSNRRKLREILDRIHHGKNLRFPTDSDLDQIERVLNWLTKNTADLEVLVKSLKVTL